MLSFEVFFDIANDVNLLVSKQTSKQAPRASTNERFVRVVSGRVCTNKARMQIKRVLFPRFLPKSCKSYRRWMERRLPAQCSLWLTHMPFADRRGEEYIGQPLITQPVSTWRLETMTVQSDCNCTKVVNKEGIPCSKQRALRI
jgi:hypothetical protein